MPRRRSTRVVPRRGSRRTAGRCPTATTGGAGGGQSSCVSGWSSTPRSVVVGRRCVGEVEEPVIPVVAARDGEEVGAPPRGARHRRSIGPETAVFIVRARGHRVDLVATHHQDGPAPGAMTTVAIAQLEIVLSQQARHRGRVPPVAEIGDVVESTDGLAPAETKPRIGGCGSTQLCIPVRSRGPEGGTSR